MNKKEMVTTASYELLRIL